MAKKPGVYTDFSLKMRFYWISLHAGSHFPALQPYLQLTGISKYLINSRHQTNRSDSFLSDQYQVLRVTKLGVRAPGGLGNMLLESDWLGLVPSLCGSPNFYWHLVQPGELCQVLGYRIQRWVDKGSGLRVPCLVREGRWTTDTHTATRRGSGSGHGWAGAGEGLLGRVHGKSFLDISGIGSKPLPAPTCPSSSQTWGLGPGPVHPKWGRTKKTPFCWRCEYYAVSSPSRARPCWLQGEF